MTTEEIQDLGLVQYLHGNFGVEEAHTDARIMPGHAPLIQEEEKDDDEEPHENVREGAPSPTTDDDDNEEYDESSEEGEENDSLPDNAAETNEINERTHYVTRRGRQVKLRLDLYNYYSLIQQASGEIGIGKEEKFQDGQTPSVRQVFGVEGVEDIPRTDSSANDTIIYCAFTQYSLKQALRKFPSEAKEAIVAEMEQ